MFAEHESTVLCETRITLPAVNADTFEFEKLLIMDGFNRYLGSTDSTHIGMLLCAFWVKINHLGPKLKMPSRSYDGTVTC